MTKLLSACPVEVSQANKFVWIERHDRLALTFKVPIIFVAVGSQNVIVFYLKMSNILLKKFTERCKKGKKENFSWKKEKFFFSPPWIVSISAVSLSCCFLYFCCSTLQIRKSFNENFQEPYKIRISQRNFRHLFLFKNLVQILSQK